MNEWSAVVKSLGQYRDCDTHSAAGVLDFASFVNDCE